MTTLRPQPDEIIMQGTERRLTVMPILTRKLDFDWDKPMPSGNVGGFWASIRYIGNFTPTADQPEGDAQMRVLTKEEMRQMDAPYPPEEGYDEE